MKTLIQLAPVKGITDRTFRSAFVRHFGGLDSALAPFLVKTDSLSKFRSLSPDMNPGLRTVPQLVSKLPDDFIMLAARFAEYGCDEVNWNLGCPFAVVTGRGEGAALLQYPDRIESFLGITVPALTMALSVKMRAGMHSPDEILKIIPVLNRFPLREIIIHPRTGEQMYDGELYPEAFSRALELSAHPVIYNGDIKTVEDYRRLSELYPGVKGWMIGRGLLENPMLAMEIQNGTVTDSSLKLERIKQFADYLCSSYIADLQSPQHVVDKMKGVWSYLSRSFPDSGKIEKRIRKVKSLNHYLDEVKRIFG